MVTHTSKQEIDMNEKIESFCKELRTKLDGVDKRIKDLKAGAKTATEKAKVEAKAQLAALDNRAKDQRAKIQATEAKAKAWLEQKKTATSEKIAAWKAQHDVSKLAAHADSAENYAVASMQLAVAAVDEAERAAVEAVVARMDADAAPPSSTKNA
jgi:membrane protein involved in colicin uptake